MDPSLPWQRPRLIRDLGIASFVNTGFFTMLYGMGLLTAAAVRHMPREEYDALMNAQLRLYGEGEDLERMQEMMGYFHSDGVALMGVLLLRTVVRLTGLMGLWKGHAWGFHVYAFAQLAGIFAPHLVLPWSFLGLGGALCAIGMTALYGTQRKYLA